MDAVGMTRSGEHRPWRRQAGPWPLAAALLLGFGCAAQLRAAEASAWARSPHAAVRLLDAGPASAGERALAGEVGPARLVGVEVRLDPPFITYWRSPGDAGVPPTFDVAASDNVGRATVLYPAPRLLDEDGSAAFGYDFGVTFPVVVAARDPSRPATLDLGLDYAVCAKICLPAKARLQLRLEGEPSAEAERVRAAVLDVPKPKALGEAGPVRIDGLDAGPGATRVRATTPDGTGTLFAEAPEPWYVEASPGRSAGSGQVEFTLRAPDRPPPGPVPRAPLRLTLVSPDGAIEVAVPLDEALPKP